MLLNCHTYFSVCYGTFSVEGLLDDLTVKGYRRFVISDINSTSAVLDTMRLCEARGLEAIPGVDFRNGACCQYIGIARNNRGFTELNKHLSAHLAEDKPFPDQAPLFADVSIVYPLRSYKGHALRSNEYLGVTPQELTSLTRSSWRNLFDRMVALQPVSFADARHFNAHRLLRAIQTNALLSKLPASAHGSANDIAPPANELASRYAAFPGIVTRTAALLSACHVHFQFGKLANKNLRYYTGSEAGDTALLRSLAYGGADYRYPNAVAAVAERIERELAVIGKMGFASYFLINHDIVSYARSKGYYYVGRGSGANSIVAYLLRITDVDPIELNLYFERFINEHRSNAPDFDIDFSWTDRDDITRYIFERFGPERTALLGAYSTFQHDAVVRELGKVFGLPPAEIDRLQKKGTAAPDDRIGQLILRYGEMLKGFPRHLSIHASGILISEEPIHTYTATFVPPKGYPTTQFSMLEAEDIGLFKFDILSQRGLAKIRDTVELVRKNHGVDIDIHDIARFKEDPAVKQMLVTGRCIGCFYVESPAMRMLLTKLKADDYLRLVAASSIIRPGVSKSGMMREYILRFRDERRREAARAALPELYDLLEETYGVMVYQEDVIKIAHLFAGLSLAEADYLRRGMSWKFRQRNDFFRVKEKFFLNCAAKGYPADTVRGIWEQIESFANFAFAKGHSASYAVESYQALYLKAHFPIEYMVATLNNGGGFYRPEIYVHEARMHGATISAPCVNTGEALVCARGQKIVLGLRMISGIEEELVARIIADRTAHGAYSDLYDFVRRTEVSIDQVRLLIRAGAFAFTGKKKKELLWDAHLLINPVKKETGAELFDVRPATYKLPELEHSWLDDAMDEIELLGFALCSPWQLLDEEADGSLCSSELADLVGQTVEVIGYQVATKEARAASGERMLFGTFLDAKGRWIDTVHFPHAARQFPFAGPGCYLITGKVVSEFDYICIEVSAQTRLAMRNRDDDFKRTRTKKAVS